MICSRTQKPATECGCEPSDHGLLCAIITTPSMEGDDDHVCHKPGVRSMRCGKRDEGICAECVESMLDGDFTTAELDVEFPRPVMYGVLVYDEGSVRWASLGGMPVMKAAEEFATWDRATGGDNHRVYALGVFPYERDATDLQKVEMVGKALAGFERCRQELAWYAEGNMDGGKRAYIALQAVLRGES